MILVVVLSCLVGFTALCTRGLCVGYGWGEGVCQLLSIVWARLLLPLPPVPVISPSPGPSPALQQAADTGWCPQSPLVLGFEDKGCYLPLGVAFLNL